MKLKFFTQRVSLFLSVLFLMNFLIQNPIFAQIEVNAGEDFTACEDTVNLSGTAANYETLLWTSNGDGTFAAAVNLATEYFPGANDILLGQVEVVLTAFAGGNQESDNVDVSIAAAPIINMNVEQATICYEENYTFEGIEISNYSAIQWFTTDGGGGFNNENIPNPTYYPSSFVDYAQGCIEIKVLAHGNDPCDIYVEGGMTLCFTPDAQVDLGGETHNVCYGDDYTFEEATATGTSFIQWMPITGGGYFENANSINATYVPDPEFDYPQGCIYVTLSAAPNSPCTSNIEEYAAICFEPSPEVDAGADETILGGQSFDSNPTATDFDNLLWETSGDGVFENQEQLVSTYTPGLMDLQNGIVTLKLIAYSGSNCSAADSLELSIITQQVIEIPQGLSGFSSFVNTEGLSFEEIISPIADDLVFAQNMLLTYWPEYGINTFDDAMVPGAFKVVMSNPVSLPLAGTAANHSLELPAGWSLLQVSSLCPVHYQELIAQLGANLIMLSEIGGESMIWPDGNVFTLTELMPGKAYMIKVVEADQIDFPACE